MERISALVEDGLYCDISNYKLVVNRYQFTKDINKLENFQDSQVRYLRYQDLKVFEYYHKWSEIVTQVGKDDYVITYEDRIYFYMYHGVWVKTEAFQIDNNIGLATFKFNLPVRVRNSDSNSWASDEVKDIKFREDLTKEFHSMVDQFVDLVD